MTPLTGVFQATERLGNVFLCTYTTDDVAINRIDSRILALERELRELRAERNTKIAITHLPVEILTYIFTLCVPKPGYDPNPPQKSNSFIDIRDDNARRIRWISFSHVCRAWRSLALNYPSLWTYPDFMIPNLAHAMVERSKPTIMDVFLPYGNYVTPGMLSQIQDNLWRTRSLDLSVETPLMQEFVNNMVHPMPNLKLLKVSCTHMSSLSLPPFFLGEEAPLLAEIHLNYCYIPWQSLLLRNVTVLSLSGDGRTNIPSGAQFLEVLREIGGLEVLELRHVFPQTMAEFSVVHIPHLCRLLLEMKIDACADILNHITFPETTSLLIESSTDRESGAFVRLFSCLSRLYSSLSCSPSRALKALSMEYGVIGVAFHWLVLTGWNASDISFPTDAQDDHRSRPSPDFQLTLNGYGERTLESGDVLGALNTLNLQFLETLLVSGRCDPQDVYEVDGGEDVPENILLELLGDIAWSRSVKTVFLRGSDFAYHGADALGEYDDGRCTDVCFPDADEQNEANPEANPHIFVFPALETLVILSADLKADTEPSIPEMLSDSFTRRWQHGVSTPKLLLNHCRSVPDHFEELRKVFTDIQWDRDEAPIESGGIKIITVQRFL
uniref:F-box domain-containing protein n=1 Tax=Moniliophthora roreri TaxID=221103 RepID=A0A0W0FTY3_MONRR